MPVPSSGQIRLKVLACGICGSDLHTLENDLTPQGVTPGHEFVGEVECIGEDVEGWSLGDRAVLCGYPGKSSIEPERIPEFLENPSIGAVAHYSTRAGGFGEYMLWDANKLAKVPENVTNDEAALVDTLAVGLGAINVSCIEDGKSVVIIGAGAIGLTMLAAIKVKYPNSRVVVVEPVEARRQRATELGADSVVDPAIGNVALMVLFETGGAQIVFNCAGVPPTIQQSVDMCGRGAHVVLVGMSYKDAIIKPFAWMARDITFHTGGKGDIAGAIEMFKEKQIDAKDFVTGKVTLSDINMGVEMTRDGQNHLKILVIPD